MFHEGYSALQVKLVGGQTPCINVQKGPNTANGHGGWDSVISGYVQKDHLALN